MGTYNAIRESGRCAVQVRRHLPVRRLGIGSPLTAAFGYQLDYIQNSDLSKENTVRGALTRRHTKGVTHES